MLLTIQAGILLPALLAGSAGCVGGSSEPTFSVSGTDYPRAFDAARETLLQAGFDLERVDAGEGIITTAPRGSAGLLSPWDTQQSSLADEVDDFVNDQRRRVRIEFLPLTDGNEDEGLPPGVPVAVAPLDGDEIEARVRVVIERRLTPGRTIEPVSIRRSNRFIDPTLGARQMLPVAWVAVREDPALARRLAARIQAQMASDDADPNARSSSGGAGVQSQP